MRKFPTIEEVQAKTVELREALKPANHPHALYNPDILPVFVKRMDELALELCVRHVNSYTTTNKDRKDPSMYDYFSPEIQSRIKECYRGLKSIKYRATPNLYIDDHSCLMEDKKYTYLVTQPYFNFDNPADLADYIQELEVFNKIMGENSATIVYASAMSWYNLGSTAIFVIRMPKSLVRNH